MIEKGQELANNRNTEELIKYYKKTSLDLAIQYNHDPDSLTNDEKERLIWEAEIMVELPTGYKLMM